MEKYPIMKCAPTQWEPEKDDEAQPTIPMNMDKVTLDKTLIAFQALKENFSRFVAQAARENKIVTKEDVDQFFGAMKSK